MFLKSGAGLTPRTDWTEYSGVLSWRGRRYEENRKNVYVNNLNSELAFLVILRPPSYNSFSTPPLVTLQTFLEYYRDILNWVGEIVGKL